MNTKESAHVVVRDINTDGVVLDGNCIPYGRSPRADGQRAAAVYAATVPQLAKGTVVTAVIRTA